MKYILLGITLFLSVINNSFVVAQDIKQNGYVLLKYPNGALSSEGTLVNGKPDGYWKTYYPSGQLKSEGNRSHFQLDSTWVFYSDSGRVTSKASYQLGLLHGVSETYYPDGVTTKTRTFYNKGVQDSIAQEFFINGSIKSEVPYEDGLKHGIRVDYSHDDGRIISLTQYKKDFVVKREKINRLDRQGRRTGVWMQFYQDLNVRMEGRYVEDLKNGYFRYYDKYGNLERTEKYEKGKLVEDADELTAIEVEKDYYPNARIKRQRSYKEGKLHGPTLEYDKVGMIDTTLIYQNGELVAAGRFDVNGVRQGYWENYYPGGNIKSKGQYKNGLRTGYWEFYFINGQLEQKGTYLDGELPHGKWEWYYPSGQLLRTEDFRRGKEDGELIEYSDSGTVITKGEYIGGEKEGFWVYEMGDHKEVGEYRAGRRDGEWKYFYPDGTLSFTGAYIDGFPNGEHVDYFENGKIREIGKYEMSRRIGEWRFYNPDGTIKRTIFYKEGKEFRINGIKVKY